MSEFESLEEVREDLEALLIEVIASVLSEDAMPVWDDLPPGPMASARLAIHDQNEEEYLLINVRLGMPLARVLASRMMTVADPGAEDVKDAVGELGNMAGGNVKTLLCQHARLSLPTTVLGEEASAVASPGSTAVRAAVLGQVVELLLEPISDPADFVWPPEGAPEEVGA